MEGLIPFVYKAIVQYKSGTGQAAGTWFSESPSSAASYMRLAGDSGRFQASEIQMFQPDRVFSSTTSSSSPSMAAPSSTSSAQSRRLTAVS